MTEYKLTRNNYGERLLWSFIAMLKTDNGYELFKKSWWGMNNDSWWLTNDISDGVIKGDRGSLLDYKVDFQKNIIDIELVKKKRRKKI